MSEKTYEKLLEENLNLKNKIEDIELRYNRIIENSGEEYQLLYDNTPVMMHSSKTNGIIISVNKFWLETLGYSKKEVLGSPLTDFLSEKSKEKYSSLLSDFLKTGILNNLEACIIKKNGQKINVLVSSKLMYDSDNKPIYTMTNLTDVSLLKEAEKKLKILNEELHDAKTHAETNEEKFKDLFEKSGDAILIIENRKIIDCNKAATDMLNYSSKDKFLNVHPSQLSPEYQSDGNKSDLKADEFIDIAMNKGTHRFEWIHKKSDGSVFDVEVLLTKILSKPGKEILHTVWRDITVRKMAERELRQAKDMAEESDRLKTEFINNMSHEIRTPLNGILGFSQLLDSVDLTEEKQKNYIKIIQNSGSQLLSIIDDILEISELESKNIKLDNNRICLNDFLMELFSEFDLKAKEKKLPFYLNKALSDSESYIYIDDSKLNKIMNILLNNAIKFTNTGFVEFGYTFTGGYIEIYVKDTGPGINTGDQNLIFERFSQLNSDILNPTEGLGLGLAIAKENAELINSKIEVKSLIGKGSMFFFRIPVNNDDSVSIDVNRIDTFTILIAEDEEVNYLYLESIFETVDLDISILHAKNGEEAVEIVKENSNITFILMDLKMPVLDGFEATKQIKLIRPDINIIAQTAYSAYEDIEKAKTAGCDDFLSKPIEVEQINSIIKKYLYDFN